MIDFGHYRGGQQSIRKDIFGSSRTSTTELWRLAVLAVLEQKGRPVDRGLGRDLSSQ